MFITATRIALSLLLCTPFVSAQLSGTVGPTTTHAAKRTIICNVLNYGGVVGSPDIGPAILSAFTNCVKVNSGSTLYVPPGNYDMATWVTLDDGSHWAFQLDATTGGHMIIIENALDFEFYSSTSAGTIQGLGYQCRNAGEPLAAPEFHIVVQGGANGEMYNLAIRGADIGGSDGIDISGTNHWVHDVEVTNRDECVTVKSPASDFLIENIYCNQSGGSAIGSLGAGTAIENIVYKNVYTNGGNQIMMIKSNGGDGYVKNVLFQNFLATGSAYGLDIDQYWSSETTVAGNGVTLTNIEFETWNGLVVDGVKRPPYRIICADAAPCSGITLTDVWLWSETGEAVIDCESAFGTGVGCLRSGSTSSYAAATTSYTKPASYTTLKTMTGDLTAGFASTASIPAPYVAFLEPGTLLTALISEQSQPLSILGWPRFRLWLKIGTAPPTRCVKLNLIGHPA
ncbi:hypothetical protein HWV62_26987 [Athelia sp. TMB]|nr:hypothetical protein HWV62_26987 [Athelia sp. TMB]